VRNATSPDRLIAFMLYGPDMHSGINTFVSYRLKARR
jgi:hypothetical protein